MSDEHYPPSKRYRTMPPGLRFHRQAEPAPQEMPALHYYYKHEKAERVRGAAAERKDYQKYKALPKPEAQEKFQEEHRKRVYRHYKIPRSIKSLLQNKYCDFTGNNSGTISAAGQTMAFLNLYEVSAIQQSIMPNIFEGTQFYERIGERITIHKIRWRFYFSILDFNDLVRYQILLDQQWNNQVNAPAAPPTAALTSTGDLTGYQQVPYFNRFKVLHDETVPVLPNNPSSLRFCVMSQGEVDVNIPIQYTTPAVNRAQDLCSNAIYVVLYSAYNEAFLGDKAGAGQVAPPACIRYYYTDE